jgi:dTDP-glucose 4,6-dehydratase
MNEKSFLVTGGAGFIGSHFVKLLLERYPESKVRVLDKLTYCGRLENLKEVKENKNLEFIKGDICDKETVRKAMQDMDFVVNFAAESHVDRSIQDASEFIKTDVFGAFTLLEEARKQEVESFVQISTDEVYGQILKGSFKETDPLNPRNPYSASKAAADRLAYSYFTTYGLPVLIVRSSNNFGPNQFPEKIIPLFITNLLREKKVPVYGKGEQVRDWLYVKDNCEAIELILRKGKKGEAYNVGGGNEVKNIELTEMILSELGKGKEMIEFVPDRLGHDFRYSLNCEKIFSLGWKPRTPFKEGLKKTIKWYKENEWWWKPLVK